MPRQRFSDERLCWLAVHEKLRHSHRSRVPTVMTLGVLVALAGVGYLANGTPGAVAGGVIGACVGAATLSTGKRMAGKRMQEFSFAVDQVAQELSPAEREHLRATGEVPDWFVRRVVKVRRPLRT